MSQVSDQGQIDNAECVYISSLALLKMLKHARAGRAYGSHGTDAR